MKHKYIKKHHSENCADSFLKNDFNTGQNLWHKVNEWKHQRKLPAKISDQENYYKYWLLMLIIAILPSPLFFCLTMSGAGEETCFVSASTNTEIYLYANKLSIISMRRDLCIKGEINYH